ncbi:MAG TPA: hypothetical protein ENK25_09725 [Bacteroidetes bacterium]|nr:hypothetical protein [Bacteroidota bacterium]
MQGVKHVSRAEIKRYYSILYLGSLCVLAFSLPLSEFGLSLALIILFLTWLVLGDHSEILDRLRKRKSIWWIGLIYLIHLAGMIYSKDMAYGWHDLRIKLPLVILPLVMGTSDPLGRKEFSLVIRFFLTGVLAGTLAGTVVLLGRESYTLSDPRVLSPFVSHIRLALFLNLSIFILLFQLFDVSVSEWWKKAGLVVLLIWFILFLGVLRSLTGWAVFLIGIVFIGCRHVYLSRNLFPGLFIAIALIMLVLLVVSFAVRSVARFYHTDEIQLEALDEYTSLGNPYFHDLANRQVENGHYTWLYVSEKELEKAWNQVSEIPYDSLDRKGQEIRFTLIRYLTSKGLRKDAEGVSQLSDLDIRAVEQGLTNVHFLKKWNPYTRVYELIWEIDFYLNGGNPSGHSVTQRMEYWKTGWRIWKAHPLIGVGTGDVQGAYEHQYLYDQTCLSPEWRLRAHNQYLTFLLTFGIVGFLGIMAAMGMFVFLERRKLDYFSLVFILVAGLSMVNEDTLETHTGVCFFSFFLSLFFISRKEKYGEIKGSNDAGSRQTVG